MAHLLQENSHTLPQKSKKDKQLPPARTAATVANQIVAPTLAAKAARKAIAQPTIYNTSSPPVNISDATLPPPSINPRRATVEEVAEEEDNHARFRFDEEGGRITDDDGEYDSSCNVCDSSHLRSTGSNITHTPHDEFLKLPTSFNKVSFPRAVLLYIF